MAKFHKNGIMILKNKQGDFYVFEKDSTLAEVAKFIWADENFSNYYVQPTEKEVKNLKIHYIDLKKELSPRLRNFNELIEDTFYEEN